MPFNLIFSIYPVFLMAMPVNMILVMYVILCILSYDFNKLTMLYIHVHISISMTNKSGLTFFLSIKYLSVCILIKADISAILIQAQLIFNTFEIRYKCQSPPPPDYLRIITRGDICARE